MKRTIKTLLQRADASSVEEMAKLCPMTDEATKERIFRKVQQRTGKSVSTAHPAPPAPQITKTQPECHMDWGTLLSAAAACVTLIGTTAGCLYLMQHKPPVAPGTNMPQDSPAAALAMANEQNMPWKHHVLQADSIGGMELKKVSRSALTSAGERYNMLTVKYFDPDSDTPHGVVIEYSAMPAEDFWSVQDGGFTFALTENGHFYQTVDFGAYRVSAEGNGLTEEELHILLDALDS